jgi:hypothetical protein
VVEADLFRMADPLFHKVRERAGAAEAARLVQVRDLFLCYMFLFCFLIFVLRR